MFWSNLTAYNGKYIIKNHDNQVNKVVTIILRDGKQVGKAIIIIGEDYFNYVASKLEEVCQLQLEGNFLLRLLWLHRIIAHV